MLDVDGIVAKMDEVGVDKIAFIPAINDPIETNPERLLKLMRVLMRGGATTRRAAELAHKATIAKDGNLWLGGKLIKLYPQPDNDPVAKIVEAHPDRFLGWIFLNPRDNPKVLDQLEQYRSIKGMVGVKLHPHWHDYETERLDPILGRCEELGLPVLIHFGFSKGGNFRSICRKFPRLVVISAHAGFPFYDDLWVHAPECPNLYVDLSSPYIDEDLARAAVRAMGSERCLYGTDAPYGFHEADGSYDYREIRSWVERLPVHADKIDGILGGHFAELIGL